MYHQILWSVRGIVLFDLSKCSRSKLVLTTEFAHILYRATPTLYHCLLNTIGLKVVITVPAVNVENKRYTCHVQPHITWKKKVKCCISYTHAVVIAIRPYTHNVTHEEARLDDATSFVSLEKHHCFFNFYKNK